MSKEAILIRINFLRGLIQQNESELRLGAITLRKYYETIAEINAECDLLERELKKSMGLLKWLLIKMTSSTSALG